ncbi:MAG: (4Fe-4S)-binding protein [Bacilli bacterium]|jgi:uncharacterized Fe-S cluster protein YjdI|nr:(4Fe-4S)-binding protein [Bacilli bacterium]
MSEKNLIKNGYRKYSGDDIDIYFNIDVCQHSGNCTHSNNEVFNVKRKPWIIANNGKKDEICQIIDKCPSGALKYIKK